MTRLKSPFQQPIIDEPAVEGAQEETTLQMMTRYYFIIYDTNFAATGAALADVFPILRC